MTVYLEQNFSPTIRLFHYWKKLSNVNRSLFFPPLTFSFIPPQKHTGATKINSLNLSTGLGNRNKQLTIKPLATRNGCQ